MAPEFEFSADDWGRLTTPERIERCRTFADQARRLSADASPELKLAYLELARHWLQLVEEMEQHRSSTPA